MGCCISSNKKSTLPPKLRPVIRESDGNNNRENRVPPPCLEEETIKEVVLSETALPTTSQPQHPTLKERNFEAKDLNLIINKHEQGEGEGEGGGEEEISQVSEMYSISESFSTTTTATTVALTEIKGDEAISKETSRESNNRSPAKVLLPRRHLNARARPQAKRADSSRVLSRPVPGRTTVTRNVGPAAVVRRERGGGSSSIQGLRSTATGMADGGVGRSRRRSPGKVTTGRASSKLREEENEGKKKVDGDVSMEKREVNESLDNPHVSLECFIFL